MTTGLIQLRRPGVEAPARSDAAPVAATPAAPAVANQPAPSRLAYVETYGCQMNVADSDMLLGMLGQAGYGRTEDPSRAELILFNTCAVREQAEERVFTRAGNFAHFKRKA